MVSKPGEVGWRLSLGQGISKTKEKSCVVKATQLWEFVKKTISVYKTQLLQVIMKKEHFISSKRGRESNRDGKK